MQNIEQNNVRLKMTPASIIDFECMICGMCVVCVAKDRVTNESTREATIVYKSPIACEILVSKRFDRKKFE